MGWRLFFRRGLCRAELRRAQKVAPDPHPCSVLIEKQATVPVLPAAGSVGSPTSCWTANAFPVGSFRSTFAFL